MAQQELTGGTHQDLADLKHQYHQSHKYNHEGTPFEDAYCLTEIGKQPEDYDGPVRYCKNRACRDDDGNHTPSCNFHGRTNGAKYGNEQLEKLAGIKHGMYATDEHLEEVFTDADRALYDYIMSWADTYGWPDREEDPSRYDDLEAIAIASVRNQRANKFILDEGELKRQEIYDEKGNLVEKDNPHALSEDVRLKRKLIMDIKKELGITPKARSQMNTDEQQADALDQLADVASQAVLGSGEDSTEFNPDDEVFEDDGGS